MDAVHQMGWARFQSFLSTWKDTSRPLVPVVGSGVNSFILGRARSGAPSQLHAALDTAQVGWGGLLARVLTQVEGSQAELVMRLTRAEGIPTLVWDGLAAELARRDDAKASQAESHLRQLVAQALSHFYPRDVTQACAPSWDALLGADLKHVISYNFDAMLCDAPRFGATTEGQPSWTWSRRNPVHLAGRRGNTTVWYPHGHVAHPESILLGARAYGAYVAHLDAAYRRHMQALRLKSPTTPHTWVDVALQHPLLFMGLSMTREEWDLWWMLTARARRWARERNAPPVFVFTRVNDSDAFRTLEAACQLLGIHLLCCDDHASGWKRLLDTMHISVG